MIRWAAGCARPPDLEARARAIELGKGQAQLARAARWSESISETRSGMRALDEQQKWMTGPYSTYVEDITSSTAEVNARPSKTNRFGLRLKLRIAVSLSG